MSSKTGGNAKVLSKRYELSRKLGTGGMADVLLGRDRTLGRTVAVKMLLPQFAEDPHFIARFRREAQSAAALNHPNIVAVYDTGSDDGINYIVMEFVDGKTLREIIREEGPLLPERAGEVASEVCAALAFAHSRGIVHRDVKPGNIMVTSDGSVKVTDFGIARAMSGESVTQTATVLGTAQYFSPEQAEGKPVDHRSDVYSLGIVLYEMLTRQVPFTGSSPVAIAYKHVKESPIPPSRLNPDVPPALEAVVMKALAKNPANRYQTAQELREDILRWLAGRPVSATPVLHDATGVVSPLAEETVVVARGARAPSATTRSLEAASASHRRAAGYVLLTLIALAAAGALVWAAAGALTGPRYATVPSVIGQAVGRAQDILKRKGFDVSIEASVPSDEFASGMVMLQSPAPGERYQKGRTVTLTPSSGSQLVKTPDLRGKTESKAREILTKVGLKVGETTRRPSDSVPKDRVIEQSPKAGYSIKAGQPVDLVISSGKPTVLVPDVVGLTEDEARLRIEGRGLVPAVQYRASYFDCQQEPGRVCAQDPPPDTEVDQGSTVTIIVAQPYESPSPTPSANSTESPSGGPTL
ncbi:MAG: Stk1 family PASTA domain-containing Ser/Thr kinase [Acidobacteria bacterium]|nr:Stk1 family PASTA domain-containing Ser/Thr kinase [Acidobacteriota bacterium]